MIPPTFTVITSKGRHLYFRQPAGSPQLGNGRGELRGRGIDGVLYAPADPAVPVAITPQWLVAALRSTPQPAAQLAPPRDEGLAYGRLRGVVAAILNAKEGKCNCVLYWAS